MIKIFREHFIPIVSVRINGSWGMKSCSFTFPSLIISPRNSESRSLFTILNDTHYSKKGSNAEYGVDTDLSAVSDCPTTTRIILISEIYCKKDTLRIRQNYSNIWLKTTITNGFSRSRDWAARNMKSKNGKSFFFAYFYTSGWMTHLTPRIKWFTVVEKHQKLKVLAEVTADRNMHVVCVTSTTSWLLSSNSCYKRRR